MRIVIVILGLIFSYSTAHASAIYDQWCADSTDMVTYVAKGFEIKGVYYRQLEIGTKPELEMMRDRPISAVEFVLQKGTTVEKCTEVTHWNMTTSIYCAHLSVPYEAMQTAKTCN